MTTRRNSPASIARHMLDGALRAIVRVRVPVNPVEVAADLQASLSKLHPMTCWLHAREDLGPIARFAVDHGDHPLVVTTESHDWSHMEDDRAWNERGGSLAFVLPEEHLRYVPPQVASLLQRGFLVRRNPLSDQDDAVRRLTQRVRTSLLARLGADIKRLQVLAWDVNLRWERVSMSGSSEAVFQETVLEALRFDCLDDLVWRLYGDYPDDEIRDLYAEVQRACRCLDDPPL